ncbi:MAG: hypothetical protein JWR61_3108 [Ferruginibacter sp.]|nr:hypothetical protein [Ferruginibacter sp.]
MKNLRSYYIYFLCLFSLLLLFMIGYYKYKKAIDTVNFHENVKVRISKVVCSETNNRYNYLVFSYNETNHILNVGMRICESYKVGDSVNLLYNRNYDTFYSNEINTRNEVWGMTISGFFFFIVLIQLFFKWRIGKRLKLH